MEIEKLYGFTKIRPVVYNEQSVWCGFPQSSLRMESFNVTNIVKLSTVTNQGYDSTVTNQSFTLYTK